MIPCNNLGHIYIGKRKYHTCSKKPKAWGGATKDIIWKHKRCTPTCKYRDPKILPPGQTRLQGVITK